MEHEILQAMLCCIEKYPKGSENKEWFIKLIQNSLGGMSNPEIDADLFFNATVIENLLANLLAVDIKVIVKVRMVHKIINTLWEENKWDITLLNSYILGDKPEPQNISQNNPEISIPAQDSKANPILIEELPFQEIEMSENDSTTLSITSIITPVELQSTSQTITNSESTANYEPMDLIGQDITEVLYYDMRNRTANPLNPYHVTKNKTYHSGSISSQHTRRQ